MNIARDDGMKPPRTIALEEAHRLIDETPTDILISYLPVLAKSAIKPEPKLRVVFPM